VSLLTLRVFIRSALLLAAALHVAQAQAPPGAASRTGMPSQSPSATFAPLRADGNGVAALTHPVTITVQRVAFETAMQDVAHQADLGITYSRDLEGLRTPVSLSVVGMSAASVLVQLARGTPLQLLVSAAGQIVLVRRDEAQQMRVATITGIVRERGTLTPIADARVELAGTALSVRSGSEGRFTIRAVPPGPVTLAVQRIGYHPVRLQEITVADGETRDVTVDLAPQAMPLAMVVVTPSHFGVMQQSLATRQTLSRDDIENTPQLGEDTFRALGRLPGIANTDFSAAFRVRGGTNNELYVSLDGLQLYEPFHLKDFDGSLSIVDVGAVGGIDLTTGGFGVQYGDRLTGVMEMRTTDPAPGESRTTLGLSVSNIRGMSRGTFRGDRGRWLVSLRHGYLEYMLRVADADSTIVPHYWDAVGKVEYDVGANHTISAHVLQAGDRMTFLDDGTGDPNLTSDYGSGYGWLTWRAAFGERVEATTVLSTGKLSWNRSGQRYERRNGPQDLSVEDHRTFNLFGLRQEWSAEWSDRALLKWGFDVRSLSADYGYASWQREYFTVNDSLRSRIDSTLIGAEPTGNALGVYIAQRVRPWSALTAELGLRYDRQSYTGDAEAQPRLNVEFAPHWGPTLRAAWGRFSQAQGIHEMQVQDGIDRFFPAEVAEHRMVGIEHSLRGADVRLEAYQRRTTHERPRYTNLYNHVNTFPEVEEDRALVTPDRGVARGVEFLVKHQATGRFGWSASYSLSSAKDLVAGAWIPRPFDQRHAVTLDATLQPSPNWRLTAAWLYHSGWPITTAAFVLRPLRTGGSILEPTFGPLLTTRLPSYNRVDLRGTRTFHTHHGDLSAFIDIFNMFNRTNARAIDYSISLNGTTLRVDPSLDRQLPRLPTFGLSWEF
jgi:hypothetical protein